MNESNYSPEFSAILKQNPSHKANSLKSLTPLCLYIMFQDSPETQTHTLESIRKSLEKRYEISIKRQALGRVLHTLAEAGYCKPVSHVAVSNGRNSLAPLFLYFILSGSAGVHHTQAQLLAVLETDYHVTMNRQALGRILHALSDSGLGFSMNARGFWYEGPSAAA